ncbi:hypothetical protein Amac_000020 [Acrocarpospora macrocephala]|uniref:Uncharacterized protein n=1 Tax=Acrocarpospora macrocephala TaxID=150177 RepID=A0A5M3WBJ1_9ACTN|nr:hypothetical protein Amac_000020 [Acrocarpospora macrocephala]
MPTADSNSTINKGAQPSGGIIVFAWPEFAFSNLPTGLIDTTSPYSWAQLRYCGTSDRVRATLLSSG